MTKIGAIAADDIVEVDIRGRVVIGRVTEVNDGIVYFRPIRPGVGWRHAKAREIVTHWRKTGRRADPAQDADDGQSSAAMRGQLSFGGGSL